MAPKKEKLEALSRLWNIANGHSGQCRIVAKFLLGLYNGYRFPFDLTDFRCLDTEILHDCLSVLIMDASRVVEVHEHLGVPGAVLERLAKDCKPPSGTTDSRQCATCWNGAGGS